MILIADSGSTKTDWRLVDDNGLITSFSTIGFNPYFIKPEAILKELDNSELKQKRKEISAVYFYGAGCSSIPNNNVLISSLSAFFSHAKIEVNHDMLAAARASCDKNEGIVAILGTGSNSCFYDGENIVENIAALGFVLGDYGSGADIGKTFIKAYLEKELPQDIELAFTKEYNLSLSDILEHVYQKELPNRFLASFNLFVLKHINDPFIYELVKRRLNLFFEKNICKYANYQSKPLSFIGSIAFVYKNIINEIVTHHQIKQGVLIKQPIEHLAQFHIKNK